MFAGLRSSADRILSPGRLFIALGTVVVAVFLLSHLPIFVEVPVPRFRPDWGSYFQIVRSITAGEWPDVSGRPPFYPLFVAAVLAVGGGFTGVVVVQSLALLGAVLFAVNTALHLNRGFGVLTAVAAVAVVGRSSTARMDNWVLTEPVYATLMILVVTFLVRGLHARHHGFLAMASVCAGLAVWTKPAALWTLVLLAMAVVYVIMHRRGWRAPAALAAPVAGLLLILASYNAATVGHFTVASTGGVNLSAATWFYWQPSPSYPAATNQLIRQLHQNAFDCGSYPDKCRRRTDVRKLRASWNLDVLSDSYQNLFGVEHLLRFGLWDHATRQYDGPHAEALRNGTLDFMKHPSPKWRILSIMGRIGRTPSFDAIAREPGLYLKTVLASMYRFYYLKANDFWAYKAKTWRKIVEQMRRYKAQEGDAVRPSSNDHCDHAKGRFAVVGRFCENAVPAAVLARIDRLDGPDAGLPALTRAYRAYFKAVQKPLFAHRWTGILFVPVLLVALSMTIWTRARHDGAAVATLITSACLGSGLVVGLVEIGNRKYAEPSMFLMFWSAACVILLLPQMRNILSRAGRPA